jgi:hypothetical protein
MWIEWRDGRISFIRDYRYARYVVADAEPGAGRQARGRGRCAVTARGELERYMVSTLCFLRFAMHVRSAH